MKKRLMAWAVVLFSSLLPFLPISGNSVELNYNLQSFPVSQFPSLIQPQQNVLFEDFTATWCGWCHYSYDIYDSLYAENRDKIQHIRYHNQDSLTMPTIRERADFYKVTGFPTMVFNGDKKIVGADATTYPVVKKIVDDLLMQSPAMGMNSFGTVEGKYLVMTVILQNYLTTPLTGQFLTVFTESQVMDTDEKVFNFVSRSVFPDFKGLAMTLEPKTVYYLKFRQAIQDMEKATQFEAVSFFQNFSTSKIYNSCFYSFNSLPLFKTSPMPFESGVRRDTFFEVYFKEALVVSTLQDSVFQLMDQDGGKHALEWEYDTVKKLLRIYPLDLLKKNSGYMLRIEGGRNSLSSSSKRYLRTDYILPLLTSENPDLTIELSQSQLAIGEVWPIDKPAYPLVLEETHGVPVRVKVVSKVPWIVVDEPLFTASKQTIMVRIKPDMMKPGVNSASLLLSTQAGNFDIPVKGSLFKPDYPLIRFEQLPLFMPLMTVTIHGKTDGYRLFLADQEIPVDLEGYFEYKVKIQSGYNLFTFKAMNMQRKIGTFSVMIIGFNP